MKKHIFMIILLVLWALPAHAENLSFTWSYETADEAQITGYRIYEVDAGLKAAIPPGERTASFEDVLTGGCNAYYIVAVNGDVQSEPSNTASWCPKVPTKPMTFTITIVPVQ